MILRKDCSQEVFFDFFVANQRRASHPEDAACIIIY